MKHDTTVRRLLTAEGMIHFGLNGNCSCDEERN